MANKVIKKYRINSTWTAPAGVTAITASTDSIPMCFDTFGGEALGSIAAKSIDGRMYAWGVNADGQLGDNSVTSRSVPTLVLGAQTFIQTASGYKSTHFLTNTGDIYGTGSNQYGGLGDGASVTWRSSPILMVGGGKYIQVAALAFTTVALASNGSVWCCGANTSGQLGDGSYVSKSSPVLVVGNGSYIQVAASTGHGAALKPDGSVWCWGTNLNGQLGDGTLLAKSSPVLVLGSTKFVQISAGYHHMLGLSDAGDVWAWGENINGQLGDGTVVDRSSPVLVSGGIKFVQVSSIYNSSFGLTASGVAYSWGLNDFGQLGDGTVVEKSSPVLVTGNHVFVQLGGAGRKTGAGVKTDGTIYCWGDNTSGQLCDGTVLAKSSPILISGGVVFNPLETSPMGSNFERVISVTPGTTYSINFNKNICAFDGTVVGYGCMGTELTLSYDI